MTFVAVMITCPTRATVRSATLERLRKTDWTGDVIVSLDTSTHPRRQERQLLNAREALKLGVESEKSWILFLEDDLEFNAHIQHNLISWPILPKVQMASLYNPTIRELERNDAQHYFVADPSCIYGSQAYLFSRDCAAFLVEHWHEVPGMQDIKASRLAALRGPIYYHTPSLVQHVGIQSAWGGHFHYTKDFDPAFKA